MGGVVCVWVLYFVMIGLIVIILCECFVAMSFFNCEIFSRNWAMALFFFVNLVCKICLFVDI